MKAFFTALVLMVSALSYCQSSQQVALKAGDTLTVSSLQLGKDQLLFQYAGTSQTVHTDAVEAYYVNNTWYDMITGLPMGEEPIIMAANTLPLYANPNQTNSEFQSVYLRKAGTSLILGTVIPVLLGGLALIAENDVVANYAAVGAAGLFIGFQISAGINLHKAARY